MLSVTKVHFLGVGSALNYTLGAIECCSDPKKIVTFVRRAITAKSIPHVNLGCLDFRRFIQDGLLS